MEEQMRQLKSVLNAMAPIADSDWQVFSRIWKPHSARRKEIITEAGETEKYLYFVLAGIQRVNYFDDQGRSATIVFTYPPSFGGVIDSFLLQKPSRYSYEALTPSSFLRTSASELNDVILRCPAVESVMFRGTSQVLSGVLERLTELQCFSSEEKFRSLLNRSPHILNLIPHKYLADYIGIDATNFSKLLNKVIV